nr:MAG TPA: hypothetical protein [Caudoviricetes sp.]DAS84659.1 MAG TPA: hypothetical protein [Caudoviricetes sp.]
MSFIARSVSSAKLFLIIGIQILSVMKTSKQQILKNGKGKSTYLQADSPVSLSVQLDSDLERTMTATSGQRCYELSGKYSPLSSLVKMLLESSQWYSPLRRLKWVARPLYLKRTTIYIEKNSSSLSKPFVQILNVKDIPCSRLLFRLVPSVRPIKEIGCGSLPKEMLPTPITQGLKVCKNGKQKFYSLELLPTPLAVEIQRSKRIKELKEKGGRTMGSRKNGERRPSGLMDYINFHGILPTPCAQDFKKRGENSKQKGLPDIFSKMDWLLTPTASDGRRSMMTMDNLKAHRKPNAEQSNLAEQIAHKIGGGTSQLSPLFVSEMMGFPLMYLVLPFLLSDGGKKQ